MSKKNDSFISRQIIEVRFKNKVFNFIDIRGEFADYVVNKLKYEEIAIAGNRVDFTTLDRTKKSFFSWENFGIQLDGEGNFDNFNKSISENIVMLKNYKKISLPEIIRIGTRITGLYHFPNKSVAQIKKSFDDVFFSHQALFEEKSGISIKDNGLFAMDIEKEGLKAHVSVGIMTKDESIAKVFSDKLYDAYNYESGIFHDIDLYDEAPTVKNFDDLQSRVSSQIEKLRQLQLDIVKKLEQ
ncbi:MAG: hypothetical protein NTZ65_01470 [Candidatus Berkelbacteria bacterium]|nr:hypothetical protein [Candidatus Berkelbacteria bacterium]